MLRDSKALEGCAIGATDGTIGEVKDLYFDDDAWTIRYLVVATGAWLSNRRVLISPCAIGQPQWAEKVLPASLTQEQVKNSPDIDTDKPISRQHEIQYLKYYSYPSYWGGAGLWGVGVNPNLLPLGSGFDGSADPYSQSPGDHDRLETGQHPHADQHLRSCNAVMKYHIRATDGDIGHVYGLLVDDETWAIRYLIVDTSNWWLGHRVLLAPQWIDAVSWADGEVSVDLTRQAVKDSPPYDAAVSLGREQETDIYQHYARAGYWAGAQVSGAERSGS
jgi:PRC-barrel domain protein